jgi:hypothetical protein
MHQLIQFAMRLLGEHQGADHFDAAAGGSGTATMQLKNIIHMGANIGQRE